MSVASDHAITLAHMGQKRPQVFRHERYWTGRDDARLRVVVPLGIREMRRAFPGKTDSALRCRAYRLGLSVPYTTDRGSTSRWRGRLPIPSRAHPLVRRLFAKMNEQRVTLSEIADRAGISRKTISGWRYVSNPHLPNLVAAFNVLGYELSAVPQKTAIHSLEKSLDGPLALPGAATHDENRVRT